MRYPLYDDNLSCEPFSDNTLDIYYGDRKIATGRAERIETETDLFKAAVAILDQVYKDKSLDLIGATEAAEILKMKRPTFQWYLKSFFVENLHYYVLAGKIYVKPETIELMRKVKDSKR